MLGMQRISGKNPDRYAAESEGAFHNSILLDRIRRRERNEERAEKAFLDSSMRLTKQGGACENLMHSDETKQSPVQMTMQCYAA